MSDDIGGDVVRAAAGPVDTPKRSRSRAPAELRTLARDHTRAAIRVLVGVMRSEDATPAARVSAANAILERGWGRGVPSIDDADATALKLFDRIERIIVHPGSAARES